jgi:hypothetical protein
MDEEDHINKGSYWVQIILQWILCDMSNIRFSACIACKILEMGSLNLGIFLQLEGSRRIHIQLVIKLLAYKLALSRKPLFLTSLEVGLVCKSWLAPFSNFILGAWKFACNLNILIRTYVNYMVVWWVNRGGKNLTFFCLSLWHHLLVGFLNNSSGWSACVNFCFGNL